VTTITDAVGGSAQSWKPRALDALRDAALCLATWLRSLAWVSCAGFGLIGWLVNGILGDASPLRIQVAVIVGSLACSTVLLDRWCRQPDSIGVGISMATAAGVFAALMSFA